MSELGAEFYGISPWKGHIDLNADDLRGFLANLIGGAGVIFINDNSMCGGMLSPLYFNHSAVVSVELFWFSRGEGGDVRKAFEEWSVDNGAQLIQMTCLANEKEAGMRRLFRAGGYQPKEIALFKDL